MSLARGGMFGRFPKLRLSEPVRLLQVEAEVVTNWSSSLSASRRVLVFCVTGFYVLDPLGKGVVKVK